MGPGSGRLLSVVTPEPGLVSWEFGMDGNLTIPGNINYANGVSILDGIGGAVNGNIVVGDSQIQFVANSSGDGYGLSTIRLVPYTAGYDSAIIIIDPTYPNHIHMRAGFEQDNAAANLFLGGEASHFNVEEGANPNVSIRSNYYTWTFATDGRLQLPEIGESSSEIFTGSGGISIKSPQYTELRYSSTDPGNVSPTLNTEGYMWITNDGAHIQNYHGGQFNLEWLFGTDGNLTFPTGGSLTFDSSAVSTIDGVTNINAVGTVGANVIQVLSDLTSFGASPAPVIYGFRSIATTGSAVNEGNISASGNLVASQNAYVTGNVFAAGYNFANGVNILSTVGAGSGTDDVLRANVGAYQIYANANAATQSTAIDAKAPLSSPSFSGTVTSGGNIVAQANVTVSNNLSVLGNLLVQGTTTTVNSTTLSITDKFITVANSSTNNSEANGAGIYVPGSSANILYTSVDDSWTLNKTIVGTANIKAASWVIGGVFAYANGVNILADVNSNAATQATSINTINANLGSYQAYANATFSVSTYSNTNVAAYLTSYTGNIAANHVIASNTISAVSITTSGTGGNITGANVISANTFVFAANGVNILTAASGSGTDDVLRANVGAYQIFANANAATQATSINTINANLGAYQTFANANVSSIQNQIFASNANIGAFQTYANATFGVSSYGNTQVAAYLLTYPNTNVATLNTTSGNIVTLRTANFNSANAVISGGYISALTNASIISATVTTINSTSGNVTTLTATNLSTANAVVTGGYASGLANITVTGNATVGNLIGSTANTTIIAGAYSSTFDNVGNVVLPNLYVSGNTTTMGIASGYAPNRPAFRVYGSGNTGPLNTSVNGNGYLNGWNFAVDYNQGSYLNTTGANNSTTAGFFTAPVTGLYQICVNARNAGNLSTISQLICYKNPTTTAAVQTMLEFGSNSSMNHTGVSTVSRLTAGDTLALKVTSGTITFDGNDNWSVTYIG